MRLHGTMRAALSAAALFTAQQACAQAVTVQFLPGPSSLIQGGALAMPAGDPGRWISDADYPVAAKEARQSGVVGFVLRIDGDGTVSDCTVTESSGSKLLDSTTCKLVSRRARFLAARNGDNDPAGARWASRVSWTLPPAAETPKT